MELQNSKNYYSKNLEQPFIRNYKGAILFGLLIFIIAFFSVNERYETFLKFSEFDIQEENAIILNQYEKAKKKSGKKYWVIKARTLESNFEFYTVNYNKLRNLKGRVAKVRLFIPKEFDFFDFLKGTFVPSYFLKVYPQEKEKRFKIFEDLATIHENSKIQEFYGTLFLATPISLDLRGDLTKLGINHLVVLSGFHVAFISLTIYLILNFFYTFFHKDYFPYRNKNRDILLVISTILIIYLLFLGTPESFLRAVTMFLFWFYLLDRNITKNKFTTLILSLFLLLALFPELIFSVGFWFSVSGVYFILLFLKYFESMNKITLVFLLNLWVFLALLPIVHFVFYDFSYLAILSPIWTILFSIFYPLVSILHLLFLGNILDELLLFFLNIQGEIFNFKFYLDELILYIFISFLALIHKELFYILVGFLAILIANKFFDIFELKILDQMAFGG